MEFEPPPLLPTYTGTVVPSLPTCERNVGGGTIHGPLSYGPCTLRPTPEAVSTTQQAVAAAMPSVTPVGVPMDIASPEELQASAVPPSNMEVSHPKNEPAHFDAQTGNHRESKAPGKNHS